MYKIDGIDISGFGVVPVRRNGPLALTGIFDLPKRKGATEYNWGTTIEPFVAAEDIKLDGRALTLYVCIKAADYKQKLNVFKEMCVACRKLWTRFGEFNVIVKDEIVVNEYVSLNMAFITVKFWQEEYVLHTLDIAPSDGEITLDGFGLASDFDIYINSRKNDKNVAKRIEVNTTLPYRQTIYRELKDVTFSCFMRGDNLDDLYKKMTQFHSLCMSPGLRELKDLDNKICKLYFKDGITVTVLTEKVLSFDLKCRLMND